MPTTMLTGGTPAYLPSRPITLIAEREGGGDAVQIHVEPTVRTVEPRPGMLVVPVVDRKLTVSVAPVSGGLFADPTVIHLTAVVTVTGSDDHDRVVLPSVRVSGLSQLDMVTLTPGDGRIDIARVDVDEGPVLPPLAMSALAAARAVAGGARQSSDRQRHVRVVVDGSRSMVDVAARGAVGVALDLLSGIAPVIGRSRPVAVTLASREPKVIDSDPSRLGAEVEAALRDADLAPGFESTRRAVQGADGMTYLVTDCIPLDHDLLGPDYHVVLLADRSCETVVSGWCAVPLTVIDAGADCRRNLLSDRMLVESTVRSLLTLVGTDTAVQL